MKLTTMAVTGVVALVAAPMARAVKVPLDGSHDTFIGCSAAQAGSCWDMGGEPVYRGNVCNCDLYYWVPRQVTNAKEGDVGLIPIAGNSGGEKLVRATLSAVGQLHRHAVMFYDSGTHMRHNTMYEDDIAVIKPVVGKVRLDENDLRNGSPGALSQTIDDGFETGRIVNEGLVLKPRWESLEMTNTLTHEVVTTDYRQKFTDAVTLAKATRGYYKLSDYTDMVSMSLPWSSSRIGNLRGSHCSGYVEWAFSESGFTIPVFEYDVASRIEAGNALHDAAVEMVNDETTWLTGALKPNADENIANQIANCFAGFDCGSLDPYWDSPGTGAASSPDNLLPTSFQLSGSRSYLWDGHTKTAGTIITNDAGVSGTPFGRVEAQVMAGGYYVDESLTSWPGDGTP